MAHSHRQVAQAREVNERCLRRRACDCSEAQDRASIESLHSPSGEIIRPNTVFRTVSLDPWIYCVSTVPFSLGRSLIERMALSRISFGAGCETSDPLGKDAERRQAATGWVGERAPLANEKD